MGGGEDWKAHLGILSVIKPAYRQRHYAPRQCFESAGGFLRRTQAFILPIGKIEGYFSSRRHIEAISTTSASYRLAAPGLGGCSKASRCSFSWMLVENGRERVVSFPKIILRPHLKTEKPKAFEGGGRRKERRREANEEWRGWN